MARTRFDSWPCSVARVVDRLGDAWSLLILREAYYGVRRFDRFQQQLGIGRNVLTQRLAALVEDGMLTRVPYQQRPVRHEYRLTDKGRAFFDVILALIRFGDDWMAPDGPPIVLRSRTTGAPLDPGIVDRATGEPIDVRDVLIEPGPGFPAEYLQRAAREERFRE